VHALSIALLSQNARRAYDKVLSPRICRCIFMILRCSPCGYFRELPVVLADATNPISSTASRHRVLCTSIVFSLPRQLQIESYYPMTTTPCGSPVYSYSNTWDLAISTILEEPTIYVGPRTISSRSWFLVKSNRNSVPNSTTLIDPPQGIRKVEWGMRVPRSPSQ
jgi:hypothetical protein